MRRLTSLLLVAVFLYAQENTLIYSLLAQTENQVEDSQSSFEQIDEPTSQDALYKIEPGDVLEIIVLGEEELARTLMVMHNGTISFPLIGEVRIIGLTTEEAAELLAVKLTRYFTHPVVSIVLKSPSLPYVSVFGEVLKPGAVEYQRGLRVTDYIALSGGPTPAANLGKVNVVRFLMGEPIIETINVHKILKEGLVIKNYELKSGDWVYVSKKFSVNWGMVIQTFTFAVAALNLYITVQNLSK